MSKTYTEEETLAYYEQNTLRDNKNYDELIGTNKRVLMWTKGVPIEIGVIDQVRSLSSMSFIWPYIALMPDAHVGRGSTIGSVIPTIGAVIPAAVGVDIGCFSGNTKILVLSGKKIKIKKLVKVTLDNGKSITCTPDHRFMLRDGTYKEARNLLLNESLMPFYRKRDKDGYILILQPYSGSYQRAHWIVARSGLLGKVPSFKNQTTVIHHKDFTKNNNIPSNLEFMSDAEHSAYHRSIIGRNLHWQSKDFEKKRINALRKKAKTKDGYLYNSLRGSLNIIRYMDERPNHHKNAVKNNGKRGRKYLINYNKSKKGREKSKEISNRLYYCNVCNLHIKSPIGWYNHQRWTHKLIKVNHKVNSVVYLTKKSNVYCLTVPEHNNFAIAAGVFVHNCGMIAQRLNLSLNDLPDNAVAKIRPEIEKSVPHGRTNNGKRGDKGAWGRPPTEVDNVWNLFLKDGYDEIISTHQKLKGANAYVHLGSLGTGNHFIEVCFDQNSQLWVMLHSGSRGIGNAIGQFFIQKAKEDMRVHQINLPDEDLAYLKEGTEFFDEYIKGVSWAQEFAKQNRRIMLARTLSAIERGLNRSIMVDKFAVNCHHNYVTKEMHFGQEVWLTRKGAVSAKLGEYGIIPGSMGAKSFIVSGKGNLDSFHTCSHGAGRKMSRTEAKEKFTVDDLVAQTLNVECRKDAGVIDEIPGAYKSIDDVMAAQEDNVEIKYKLKQILCIKG